MKKKQQLSCLCCYRQQTCRTQTCLLCEWEARSSHLLPRALSSVSVWMIFSSSCLSSWRFTQISLDYFEENLHHGDSGSSAASLLWFVTRLAIRLWASQCFFICLTSLFCCLFQLLLTLCCEKLLMYLHFSPFCRKTNESYFHLVVWKWSCFIIKYNETNLITLCFQRVTEHETSPRSLIQEIIIFK